MEEKKKMCRAGSEPDIYMMVSISVEINPEMDPHVVLWLDFNCSYRFDPGQLWVKSEILMVPM